MGAGFRALPPPTRVEPLERRFSLMRSTALKASKSMVLFLFLLLRDRFYSMLGLSR